MWGHKGEGGHLQAGKKAWHPGCGHLSLQNYENFLLFNPLSPRHFGVAARADQYIQVNGQLDSILKKEKIRYFPPFP